MKEDRSNLCTVCGFYGIIFPPGDVSPARCPACKGSKISQKPRKKNEELEL